MTVRDNMAFSLMLAKQDKATIDGKVQRAAEILALTPLLERYPRQLSGGQRQRVAMGRAIVRDPQVFLFDEPLSNLDAKLRVAMRTEIKELHQRLKTTSIYVTHDQIEAMTMGDTIVVMHEGRIEQQGSPLALYDRPANLFVAGFIGSPAMNFLPGTLRTGGAAPQVELPDGTRLPAPANGGADGQPVIYGARPEHLALVSDGGLPLKVGVVEPTGADTFVSCRRDGPAPGRPAPDGAPAGRSRGDRGPGDLDVLVVFRERHAFEPGSTIRVVPDVKRAHLYDAGTGRRLAA
jgi:multiple sugar transport system ATP-binding protein